MQLLYPFEWMELFGFEFCGCIYDVTVDDVQQTHTKNANKQTANKKEIQRQMKIETAHDNMIFMFEFIFIHA